VIHYRATIILKNSLSKKEFEYYTGINNNLNILGDNSPVGYWFTWAVFRDTTYDDYSLVCTVLPAEV
jgi:hypothetical protein